VGEERAAPLTSADDGPLTWSRRCRSAGSRGPSGGVAWDREHSGGKMSAEDLERYETEIELQLYQEYRAVLAMFKYVVETERRFYLANDVKMEAKGEGDRTYFEITLGDAWVWDMYRPARFVSSVRVVTFKDVNVEELPEKEL
jgi:Protein of unknown function (DUF2469)